MHRSASQAGAPALRNATRPAGDTVSATTNPLLLPLLVTMTLPSAWSALTNARRRYESFHT